MTGLMPAATPPLPTPFEWDQGYWDAARENRLVVQRCAACQRVRSLPVLMCKSCHSMEFEWVPASGKGTVYTWSTLYRSFHPAFSNVPFTIAIVKLDDFPQVRLITNLVDVESDDPRLHIDAPVEVTFDHVTPEVSLPRFHLLAAEKVIGGRS